MNDIIVKRQHIVTKLAKDHALEIRDNTAKINEICNAAKNTPIVIPEDLVHGSCHTVKSEMLARLAQAEWVIIYKEEEKVYSLE